jgi:hypothetical protein
MVTAHTFRKDGPVLESNVDSGSGGATWASRRLVGLLVV